MRWTNYIAADFVVHIFSFISLCLLYISIMTNNINFMYFSFGISGFCCYSIFGFVYEMMFHHGKDVNFMRRRRKFYKSGDKSLSEAFVGGALNLSVNMVSFVFHLIFAQVFLNSTNLSISIFFAVILVIEVVSITLLCKVKKIEIDLMMKVDPYDMIKFKLMNMKPISRKRTVFSKISSLIFAEND